MTRTFAWEIAIALAVLALGLAAYFDRSPTYRDLTTTVLSEPYDDLGTSLVYRWDAVVTRNCTGSFRREVRQGDTIYYLPERQFTWIPDDEWTGEVRQDFVIGVQLADFIFALKDGPASYHVTMISTCNMIQFWFNGTVESEFPPVNFNIKRPDTL